MSKANFKKVSNKYSNARNLVSGIVNSKNYDTKLAKTVDFVAYAIIHPIYDQIKQMKQLVKWGVPTVIYKIDKKLSNEMLSKYLLERRSNELYNIDGIVVIDGSKAYSQTKKNPKHGFAFKMVLTDQVAEAKVLDVLWDVSMYGYLKPRIKIEPIVISGTTIQYATAHNAKYVVDNVLGPGAMIELVRSGDVIPYIRKVIKPAATNKPKMPKTPYKWTSTKVDIVVKDIHDVADTNIRNNIITKQITKFFKILEVKYISDGIVSKLVEAGYKTIISILSANIKDIMKIEGMGSKLVKKIYKNIQNAFKRVTLDQLMVGSNALGRGFGRRKIKIILQAYPNIMTKDWSTNKLKKKILKLEGYNTKTATQFAKNFKKFKIFYNKLKDVVDISHLEDVSTKIKKKQIFKDQIIVFTGFRDKELEQKIESLGGKITSSVSSKTTLVVYVPSTTLSSKLKKAQDLGINIMEKDEFMREYGL